MESQLVTVDQFTSAISSIQEAIARLGQRDGQQVPRDQVQDDAQCDFVAPPPPLHVQLTATHVPLVFHSQAEVTMPSAVVPISSADDTQARMDRLEQRFRHMRVSDGVTSWDDFDSTPATGLPPDFRMPEI